MKFMSQEHIVSPFPVGFILASLATGCSAAGAQSEQRGEEENSVQSAAGGGESILEDEPGGAPVVSTGGTAGPPGDEMPSSGGNASTGGSTGDGTSSGGTGSGGDGAVANPGTGGSGAEVGDGLSCDDPFTYRGYDGCVTTINGQTVKYFPLAEGVRPTRMAIYFHGDTAPGWYQNWAFGGILEWAQEREFLVLGVLSPTLGGSGQPEYGEAQAEDAVIVGATIEAVGEAYNTPSDLNLYWGTSGGSWHFSSTYIATVGHQVPGLFAISCGGSGVSWNWQWEPSSDTATRDAIKLFYNYGSEDFLADWSEESAEEFEGMGFSVEETVYPGAGHCDHPIAEPTIAFWERHI